MTCADNKSAPIIKCVTQNVYWNDKMTDKNHYKLYIQEQII